MSRTNPKVTDTGKARTHSDLHPYLRPAFLADPQNWFWETDSHSEQSKAYFRANLDRMFSNVHNRVKINNANDRH